MNDTPEATSDQGSYLGIDDLWYHVLGRAADDVVADVRSAMSEGAVLNLPVEGGTLLVQGARLAAVVVCASSPPPGLRTPYIRKDLVQSPQNDPGQGIHTPYKPTP